MFSRIALSAAALLCLSACTTPAQLRASKANIDETTVKPVELVTGCIADAFEKFNSSLPIMMGPSNQFATRPTANGFNITAISVAPIGTDTLILVNVIKTDAVTHVTMFTNFPFDSSGGKWTELARGCL